MRILILGLGLCAANFPAIAAADEVSGDSGDRQIVVMASRSDDEVAVTDYAGSVTVLGAEDLLSRQTRDVAEILRDVPGVAVSSVAGQTQLRLRGAEGNHVLVLVDGIEVSDPFAGEFDMGTLQAEIDARVEVLRGPQSALYGSDAIGGVVAYETAPGCAFRDMRAYAEGGSFGTANVSARGTYCGETSELALHATLVSTDGVANARGGARTLGRDSMTFSGNGSIDIAPNVALRAVGRFVRTRGDYNDQDFDPSSPAFGLVVDSPGVRYENEALYALVGARAELDEGRWTHDLSAQIADIRRDSFAGDARTFGSEGQRIKGSYVTSLRVEDAVFSHAFTFAGDIERERFRNTDPFGFAFTGARTARNLGLVGEYRAKAERFTLSAAVRRDINNRFADATTFRVASGIDIGPATRVRASYGSGIKNPGFYELYGYVDGRFIGNQMLKPEKSTGWEIGADQKFADGAVRLSATWFESELEDEIAIAYPAPDYLASPVNLDEVSKRRGLELSAHARLGEQITFDAAYTWLDATEGGLAEVRRPGDTASAVLGWRSPGGTASATLLVRYNGAADDLAYTDPSFVPVRVTLGDYTLVGLNAEYLLADNVQLFARAENLLDERYEQVFSFTGTGRSFVAGIAVEF